MRDPVRSALTSLLLATAIYAGAWSIDPLVAASSWAWATLGILGVVTTALVLSRLWWRAHWSAPIIATLTGMTALGLIFAPGTQWFLLLPGPQTLRTLYAVAQRGAQEGATTRPPVMDSEGLALIIAAALVLALVLAEFLAIGCRAPTWSGLPLLAPWAPAVALEVSVPLLPFAVAGAAYLGVLAFHTGRGGAEPSRSRRRTLQGVAAATVAGGTALVLAVLSGPVLVNLPTPQYSVDLTGSGGDGTTRLSLGLDVSDHLIRDADELLYTYTATDPEAVGPLHAYTLSSFTGSRWERDEEPEELAPAGPDVLWPTPVASSEPDLSMTVTIEELGQDRLPIHTDPRRLIIEGEWAYDPEADEVLGTGPTPLTYRMDVHDRDVTAAQLDASDPTVADVDPGYRTVPETGYEDQIAALTRRVTSSAASPYEQVVAVQDYLRTDPQFNYSTTVEPARTGDAVWDFLGSGEGYCVQFATAMVMMLRTLDIPARLAVGFLDGQVQDDGTVHVTGHRAHAWPQVYFPDAGWVRFEATPSSQAGSAPEWTEGVPQEAPTPSDGGTTSAPQAPVEQPEGADQLDDEDVAGGSPRSADEGVPPLVVVITAALTVLGLAVLLGVLWLRRSRLSELENLWRKVERHARAGATSSLDPGATVRTVAAAADLSGPQAQSLAELVEAIEQSRYAPAGRSEPDRRQINQWREEVLSGLREQHRN